MNCSERILTALNNEQPDRVPIFELLIDESSVVNLAKLLIPKPIEVKAKKTRFGEESFKILETTIKFGFIKLLLHRKRPTEYLILFRFQHTFCF